MRPSTSLVALAAPSICLAQAQVPLVDQIKGWFNKATAAASAAASSYIPTAVPSAADIPNLVAAGAAKVAVQQVHKLTFENWRDVVAPSAGGAQKDGPQEWLIYINGGNKTCYGDCGDAEKAWNSTVALLSATPNTPSFATIDCDEQQILCNSWIVAPPSIYQFLIPKPLADQSRPATTVRYVPLNRTDVSTKNFLDLHNHPESVPVYESVWHPFDGLADTLYFRLPWAYAIHYLNMMPSWMPMILISMFSRTFMKRGQPGVAAGRQQPGAAAAPAAAR